MWRHDCHGGFGPFSQCWYLWSSISTVWTHSVTHCVLRCHTVTHSVDTQCSLLCSKVWWHCDSQSVYTIPQCENGPNPHSRDSVNTVWSTGCTTLCVHTVIDSVFFSVRDTGCPIKSGTLDFRYFDIWKYIAYFDFIRLNIVFWKEWYKDYLIWFGSIESTTISWNTVIYEVC